MARVLLLFAHPAFQKSRIHRSLVSSIPDRDDLTLHDLYEEYPDFLVDVEREQELLTHHDIVVFQHPLYWYSVPPLLKQWMDLVLEHGWAYGSGGSALHGKWLVPVVSAGGTEAAYCTVGRNRRTIRQFLAPIEQTAFLCGMRFAPPWIVYGTHRLGPEDIQEIVPRYLGLLDWMLDGGLEHAALDHETLVVPERTGSTPGEVP
ncbi:MAG: NAD(P)H-dependent oxidoreductase [Gemmatimonadetes bacterium]|nr:NAD(P)H-dependent oxidoreductase [Gemmatimonadota bacterium]NNK63573.1 NAD(P)H oxidoreductase [Gemmatimonadota bacterium]